MLHQIVWGMPFKPTWTFFRNAMGLTCSQKGIWACTCLSRSHAISGYCRVLYTNADIRRLRGMPTCSRTTPSVTKQFFKRFCSVILFTWRRTCTFSDSTLFHRSQRLQDFSCLILAWTWKMWTRCFGRNRGQKAIMVTSCLSGNPLALQNFGDTSSSRRTLYLWCLRWRRLAKTNFKRKAVWYL